MTNFNVPTREEVSEENQVIFDNLKKNIGFVPNLYASYAHNDTALGDYLAFQNRKTTLTTKEKEIINLIVSQVNECQYCLAAHTTIGKMNGFTDEQLLEIRSGEASFDEKYDALAKYVKNATVNRSHPDQQYVDALLAAGYTRANVIDIILVIGDKFVSNFLNGTTQIPVDFPEAPVLEGVGV